MTSQDSSQVSRIQGQLNQCVRTVERAARELHGVRSRVSPVADDVERLIGGTAQGADARMVASLVAANSSLESALTACAHARARAGRLGGAL